MLPAGPMRYHQTETWCCVVDLKSHVVERRPDRMLQTIWALGSHNSKRPICLPCRRWASVGSPDSGRAAAVAYTPIETANLNGADPQSWLADTSARLPDYKITKVQELLP